MKVIHAFNLSAFETSCARMSLPKLVLYTVTIGLFVNALTGREVPEFAILFFGSLIVAVLHSLWSVRETLEGRGKPQRANNPSEITQ